MSRGVQTCQAARRCPDLPGGQEVSRLARGIGDQTCQVVRRCLDLQEVLVARGV